MKKLIFAAIAALVLATTASAAGPQSKKVEIYVAVPSDAITNVTSSQAVQTIEKIVGKPTDAPCLVSWNPYDKSTWGCSIEGWYRHEVGKVFEYRITVVQIGALGGQRDACGSYTGGGLYFAVDQQLAQNSSAGFTKNDRTMIMTMGAGGWAGHFAPPNRQVDHMGMVGDWGVMEDHGTPTSCIPEWDTPSRGFSHELAGMMGMYVGGGCYEDGYGCFVGDQMSAVEKSALLKYSGQWLRNP